MTVEFTVEELGFKARLSDSRVHAFMCCDNTAIKYRAFEA